jgi:predicted PurR-regulated permease PerM
MARRAFGAGNGYDNVALVSTMRTDEVRTTIGSSPSGRIIAGGIVIGFCYWASSVLVTLLVAVLLAYFLDPVVSWLEDWRIPRALGALLIVVLTLTLLFSLAWALVTRMDQFGADWPKYRAPLRAAASAIEKKLEGIEQRVSEISPEDRSRTVVQVYDSHSVRNTLLSRLGSLYTAVLAATFVPFLVFFMLAAKRQVWHATMQLFPARDRTQVKLTLDEVSVTLRSYVIGTALVGVILVLASWLFFWSIGLDYPFLAALVSGLMNLVPYIGVVLSWIPPLIIALRVHHTGFFFLGIVGVLSFFHLMAANVLFPSLVGRRVHLNAVAVTIALLFWGWMWGAPGLLLAIPITATIKVICDHVESWQPVGRWLGA